MLVYLGLGSNMGDRQANLEQALKLLGERLRVRAVSSVYQTEPVGYEQQPQFLNAVCAVETDIGPMQLLSLVKGIEASMGRRPGFKDGPRPIDIDILLYGKLVLISPDLIIPHQRMAERAFVLIPLAELDASLLHPTVKERIGRLAQVAEGREGVKKIGELEVGDV